MICQTCKNAIFDACWGEHKCGLNGITYRRLEVCGDYKNGTPKESKENEEYNLLREDGQ